MQNLIVSSNILYKITSAHNVTRDEVEQCFANRMGNLLIDDREDHKTDPVTLWFLADTNKGRTLKVVYIQRGPNVFLKTAYEPDANERGIYALKGF